MSEYNNRDSMFGELRMKKEEIRTVFFKLR